MRAHGLSGFSLASHFAVCTPLVNGRLDISQIFVKGCKNTKQKEGKYIFVLIILVIIYTAS